MRLYEEDKSLKDIIIDPFTRTRSDFLEKMKIPVHESEEGIPTIDFHGFVFSLTKVYLEKIHDCAIREEKVHTTLELESREEKFSVKKGLAESRMYNVSLLKAGLARWKTRPLELDGMPSLGTCKVKLE